MFTVNSDFSEIMNMKCLLSMYILLVQDWDINKKHTSRRNDQIADQPRNIMFQRKAFPFSFIVVFGHEAAIPALGTHEFS